MPECEPVSPRLPQAGGAQLHDREQSSAPEDPAVSIPVNPGPLGGLAAQPGRLCFGWGRYCVVGALLELAELCGDALGSFEQEGDVAIEGRSASPVAQ